MIDGIEDIKTLNVWKKKLETNKTLGEVQKRVINARLEKQIGDLKEKQEK
jgi:hypothetical protein